jgi:effector-binding domain-containing protein
MTTNDAAAPAIETRVIEEVPTAAIFATLSVDKIGAWLQTTYATVAAYLEKFGVGPVGMPYARYHRAGDDTFDVEAGFVATTPVPGEKDVEPSEFPGGPVVVAVHIGPYETMGTTYEAIAHWLAEHSAVATGEPWEVYFSDPREVPDPSQWRTEVVQPFLPQAV